MPGHGPQRRRPADDDPPGVDDRRSAHRAAARRAPPRTRARAAAAAPRAIAVITLSANAPGGTTRSDRPRPRARGPSPLRPVLRHRRGSAAVARSRCLPLNRGAEPDQAAPEVRLDGSQGSACLDGDLVEAQLAEEAQGHDLAIWLVEPADGRPDPGSALGAQRGDRGIGPPGRSMPDNGSVGSIQVTSRRRCARRRAIRTAIRVSHAPNGPSPRQAARLGRRSRKPPGLHPRPRGGRRGRDGRHG